MGLWIVFIAFYLLRGSPEPGLARAPSTVTDADPSLDGALLYPQSVHMNNASGLICGGECHCYTEGKCRRCSWFEISRQIPECLLTGYRQLAYCPRQKRRKYVSCRYQSNPSEQRTFWAFQAVALTIGIFSYIVAQGRLRRIERMVAKRIEQQINA